MNGWKIRIGVYTVCLGWFCLGLLVGKSGAHHGRKCHTERCRDRVWAKSHPFQSALASWYDADALGGRVACGGGTGGYFVAHKTLPCGTRLRICFRRCATARVADRGPYSGDRVFDLDRTLRDAIGFDGVAYVKYRRLR